MREKSDVCVEKKAPQIANNRIIQDIRTCRLQIFALKRNMPIVYFLSFQLNGLCLRTKERKNNSDYAQIAPFALLPSFVPKQLYNQAIALQPVSSCKLFTKLNSRLQAVC